MVKNTVDPPRLRSCGTCRFWQAPPADDRRDVGRCLRFPPSVPAPQAGYHSPTLFPFTHVRTVCGEHDARREGVWDYGRYGGSSHDG